MKRSLTVLVTVVAILVVIAVAAQIIPYSRSHVVQIEAGNLKTTYNVWQRAFGGVRATRVNAVSTNGSGGISVCTNDFQIEGDPVAFEMVSARLRGSVLYITDKGNLYIKKHDRSEIVPINY